MPKSILLIAYNFPPLISPQSLRWFYLTRELRLMGHHIDVLTISMPERFTDMVDLIPKDISLYRALPGPFYYLTYKYSRENKTKAPIDKDTSIDLWRYVYKLYLMIYSIGNYILIPDLHTEWLPNCYLKGASLMKQNRYDIIISSSEPAVCHITAYLLKKRFGIRWIADYGDPWVYPVSAKRDSKVKNRLIKGLESILLRDMDCITVTTAGTKELYLKDYEFLSEDKIEVVPQGYSPDIFDKAPSNKNEGEFVLSYCGSFYNRLRDPTVLLQAIKELDLKGLKVKIAGRINEFQAYLSEGPLARIVEYRGFIKHLEALSLEKDSTALLFISNAVDTQVPGKLYEYIGAKRPILCITDNMDDLSATLIRDTHRGIVVQHHKEQIKEAIVRLYDLWREGSLDRSFNLDELNEYTWYNSAKNIGEVIDKL